MQCNVTIRNAPSHNPPLGSSCQPGFSLQHFSWQCEWWEGQRGFTLWWKFFVDKHPSSQLKKSVVFGSKTTDFVQLLCRDYEWRIREESVKVLYQERVGEKKTLSPTNKHIIYRKLKSASIALANGESKSATNDNKLHEVPELQKLVSRATEEIVCGTS